MTPFAWGAYGGGDKTHTSDLQIMFSQLEKLLTNEVDDGSEMTWPKVHT